MGARDELHGDDPGPPHTPHTHQPELFSLYEEEPGESRPDRIATLAAPQERDLRRTVQQIVDAVPLVQFLDDPAPQGGNQLVFMVLQMGLEKGFFALFPKLKKVRSWASHSGSELLP